MSPIIIWTYHEDNGHMKWNNYPRWSVCVSIIWPYLICRQIHPMRFGVSFVSSKSNVCSSPSCHCSTILWYTDHVVRRPVNNVYADDLTPPETGTSAGTSQSIATFCLQGYFHGKIYDIAKCIIVILILIFMGVMVWRQVITSYNKSCNYNGSGYQIAIIGLDNY